MSDRRTIRLVENHQETAALMQRLLTNAVAVGERQAATCAVGTARPRAAAIGGV